jgi:hypothetical protein
MGLRYLFLIPGAEIEFGISKRISVFGKAKYNFITHFDESKLIINDVRCFDFSLGIQIGIL